MKLKHSAFAVVIALAMIPAIAQQQQADQCEQNPTVRDGMMKYVQGDYHAALSDFQPLADGGDACAQWYLGQMYNFGQGVPKDREKFVALVKASAEQGYSKARAQAYAMGISAN
jgi:hypothetical protein